MKRRRISTYRADLGLMALLFAVAPAGIWALLMSLGVNASWAGAYIACVPLVYKFIRVQILTRQQVERLRKTYAGSADAELLAAFDEARRRFGNPEVRLIVRHSFKAKGKLAVQSVGNAVIVHEHAWHRLPEDQQQFAMNLGVLLSDVKAPVSFAEANAMRALWIVTLAIAGALGIIFGLAAALAVVVYYGFAKSRRRRRVADCAQMAAEATSFESAIRYLRCLSLRGSNGLMLERLQGLKPQLAAQIAAEEPARPTPRANVPFWVAPLVAAILQALLVFGVMAPVSAAVGTWPRFIREAPTFYPGMTAAWFCWYCIQRAFARKRKAKREAT